jgi:hypothetical protein
MILATMAVVVFVSTSLGALQRFEKPHSHASSTCSAPEVKQPHADTNRVALVIGNFTLKAVNNTVGCLKGARWDLSLKLAPLASPFVDPSNPSGY